MSPAKRKQPPKHDNVLKEVRKHLEAGTYLDTRHAKERKLERGITLPEVRYVLRHGHHEKRKDTFHETHNAWAYAIRGKTVDGRTLRICVSFDEAGMLVITTIDLDTDN